MSAPSALARRYLVSGQVQGVGFRWFTQQTAEAIGVRGWVRNLADGRVEVYASGSPEQLEALLNKLRQGPSMSQVREIREEEAAAERHSGFSVR